MSKTNKNEPKAPKQKKDLTGLRRAIYILAFACMLSIAAYFGILIDSPDKGQLVLGSFGLASAIYYFFRAITVK